MATGILPLNKYTKQSFHTLANGMIARILETKEAYIIQCDGDVTDTNDISIVALSNLAWGVNYLSPLINYSANNIGGKLYYNGGYLKVKANYTGSYLCGTLVLPKA